MPTSLVTQEIHMKMDLHLTSLSDNKEFAKAISEPKYYHDKRKVAKASKTVLDDIVKKN